MPDGHGAAGGLGRQGAWNPRRAYWHETEITIQVECKDSKCVQGLIKIITRPYSPSVNKGLGIHTVLIGTIETIVQVVAARSFEFNMIKTICLGCMGGFQICARAYKREGLPVSSVYNSHLSTKAKQSVNH